ncbi:hypothetical protein CEXT_25041 [Caerostris extrusa]|uniref:Uncharacterized protein n=1 Tax=Caerostris extrusa TaxID=172846 RepID=A0AAV4TM60_CAEEX|nr:hypothetical protein CEXT_25041 [Caerostris extrusa]
MELLRWNKRHWSTVSGRSSLDERLKSIRHEKCKERATSEPNRVSNKHGELQLPSSEFRRVTGGKFGSDPSNCLGQQSVR